MPQHPQRPILLALILMALAGPGLVTPPARAQAADPGAAAPAPPDSAALAAAIDDMVAPYVNLDAMSGVILVARGDTVVFAKGYGRADPASNLPNTIDTRFPIGSVAHAFITLAVIQLHQEHRLSIRDPLSKYLPDYPGGAKITLFELLNYRGGIPPLDPADPPASANLDSVIARFRDRPPEFAPGTGLRFSDTDFVLLSRVVEAVSGMPYAEYLRKRVFEPAGMADTGDENAGGDVPRQAVGLVPDPEGPGTVPAPPVDFAPHAGSSSFYSTAMDLYRFNRALAHATLTPSPAQVGLPQYRLGRRMILFGGSLPGYSADVSRYLGEDLLIVVLMNDGAQIQQIVADGVAAAVFGLPTPPFPTFSPDAMDAGLARRAAGRYRIAGRPPFDLVFTGDHLVLHGDGGQASRLIPESGDTWFSPLFWYHLTAVPADGAGVDTVLWIGATQPDTLRAVRTAD